MSSIQPKHNQMIDNEDNSSLQLNHLIESLNNNHLNQFYPSSSESIFKKNIDDLNLTFYLETEKILSESKHDVNIIKSQDKLFIILFKQINLYIKEIERLNQFITNSALGKDPEGIKAKMSFISKQKDDYEINHQLIQALKYSITSLEAKLSQALMDGNKWKEESEIVQKENRKLRKMIGNDGMIHPFFPNENSHRVGRSGEMNNEPFTGSMICTTAHMIPKKKRHLSDNNPIPFVMPITNKKNDGSNSHNLAQHNHNNNSNGNKGFGNNRSPYIKHSANKVTNFKIIKHVKQRLKSEDENCKIASPKPNCKENNKEILIKNSNNEGIPYQTHLNDLNHLEAMMLEIKNSYFPINKSTNNFPNIKVKTTTKIPQLSSIVLNQINNSQSHCNNNNNTPHFDPKQITSSSFHQSNNGQ